MTNQRLVAIGYIVLALLAGFFFEHVLLAVFGTFGITQPLTRPLTPHLEKGLRKAGVPD